VKKILSITFGILLFSYSLQADLVDGTIAAETMPKPEQAEKGYPFKVELSGDAVGKAKFKHSGEGHLKFNKIRVEGRGIFYHNDEFNEGAYATLGYQAIKLDWNENPYFSQTEFRTADLSIGAFTEHCCDWRWVGEASINIETDHPNFNEYSFYDLLLWGRYTYCEHIGIHVGMVVQTGMRIDQVYPVIGVDWQIDEKWKLNLIYPLNVSLVYQMSKCWSVALAARAFYERHRVGSHANLPRALVIYENTGGELAINYDCDRWLSVNVHAGYTTGGIYKVANQDYRHRHRFKFDGAAYAGGELALRF